MNKLLLVIIIAGVLIAAITVFYFQGFKAEEPIFCTQEAKLCPDGSYVGRTGPNCEFAQCPAAAITGNLITIENFSFNPPTLKIKTVERVTWKQNDSVVHSVISGIFQSDILNKGDDFSFTFSEAGEYGYYCGVHPSMKGKIIVE